MELVCHFSFFHAQSSENFLLSLKLAARALIIRDGEILLVRHKNRDFYALPGGKIDPDEDIQTALAREMYEELGVEVKNPRLKFIHEFRYPNAGEFSVEFFFLVGNPEDFLHWKNGTHTEIELEEVIWKPVSEDFPLLPTCLKKKLKTLSGKTPIEYVVSPAERV